MAFLFFAMAAVVWSLLVIRWSVSRRGRGMAAVLLLSLVVVCSGAASVILDVRAIRLGSEARASNLLVRVVRRGDWWQLDYQRNGISFTTANELHLPADTVVAMAWNGLPPPWMEGAVCAPQADQRCALVTGAPRITDAAFIGLRKPVASRMRVIVQPPSQFDRWFDNERRPASSAAAGAAPLFTSAGCAYCHVIRGVAATPSTIAPDLTHFAARQTIAATRMPNRRGFLSGWIVNSRAIKAGSDMPQNRLAPDVLHALTGYLESLR